MNPFTGSLNPCNSCSKTCRTLKAFALHVQEDEVGGERQGVDTIEAAHQTLRLFFVTCLPASSHVDTATTPQVPISPGSATSALLTVPTPREASPQKL